MLFINFNLTFLRNLFHRLYVPTMLVIGLHGWILPPGAILVCDLFVYSEFLIHPLLLLIASSRLRNEIARGYKAKFMVSFNRIISSKVFFCKCHLVGSWHYDKIKDK